MDVLSSRILLRPSDLDRSRRFYRDMLGLAIYREFGPPDDPGVMFFLGPGLLEVSGHRPGPAGQSVMIWIQVRDVHAGHARLAATLLPRLVRRETSFGCNGDAKRMDGSLPDSGQQVTDPRWEPWSPGEHCARGGRPGRLRRRASG